MGKTKSDKRINRVVREINKKLKEDVFGDRFWIKQVQKTIAHSSGLHYYLYEMKDRLEPNRDSLVSCGWIGEYDTFVVSKLYEQINDFIVKSDFWSIYYNDPTRYSKDVDEYAAEFNHYRLNK